MQKVSILMPSETLLRLKGSQKEKKKIEVILSRILYSEYFCLNLVCFLKKGSGKPV